MWNSFEKRPFFWAFFKGMDMAELGKYITGGNGQIRVQRVYVLGIKEGW